MNVLAVEDLVKRFGDTVAVDGVSFSVPAGACCGLIGPNGAGKTTTISMVCGLLAPDAGRARICGVDVWESPDEAKALLGVMPSGRMLPARLTGREILTYLGLLRGLAPETVAARGEELLGVLDLLDAQTTLVMDYSTGMRKKIELAVALLHAPRLLVLDEPFEGLDPVSAATVRSLLARYVERGGSLVMSSHMMELVERTCTHVTVVDHGRVRYSGSIDRLRGTRTLDAAFAELVGAPTLAAEALSWLGR